ncbi:MAG: hypothetical protein R3C26_09240 [Calditrichia bacterium]
MIVLLLSACGSRQRNDSEIIYWSSNNTYEIKFADEVVQRWNAGNAGHPVHNQPVPEGQSSEEVILAAVVGKTTPDIYSNMWQGDVEAYAQAGAGRAGHTTGILGIYLRTLRQRRGGGNPLARRSYLPDSLESQPDHAHLQHQRNAQHRLIRRRKPIANLSAPVPNSNGQRRRRLCGSLGGLCQRAGDLVATVFRFLSAVSGGIEWRSLVRGNEVMFDNAHAVTIALISA